MPVIRYECIHRAGVHFIPEAKLIYVFVQLQNVAGFFERVDDVQARLENIRKIAGCGVRFQLLAVILRLNFQLQLNIGHFLF
ncbi:hypothetical protein D3C85_1811100 [compost metagenome]